jgi:hypothetical protein
MDKKKEKKKDRIEYEAPEIITYGEDDILQELGPAQACTTPCPAP